MEQRNIFTLGPWGGEGGADVWDDEYLGGVREIKLEYNDFHRVIDSISVVYADRNKGRRVERGRIGGNYPRRGKTMTAKIKLRYPKEYLTGLSGHITYRRSDGQQFIQSLAFTTNLGYTHGPYGYEDGIPFAFEFDILEIVGFYGRSGWFLDSIGIHLRHRDETKTGTKRTKEKETKSTSTTNETEVETTSTTKETKTSCCFPIQLHAEASDQEEITESCFGGGRGSIYLPDLGLNITAGTQTENYSSVPEERKDDSALGIYGKDLTKLAKAGKLDPVIGRDDEIRRCIQILSRRTKNNPVLIGEPGVGKTAIAEGLAGKIVQGDVPQVLRNSRLISLDMGGLLAGTKYRGTFEDRLKAILKQVTESNNQIMLFIDEIHMVVGAGAVEDSMDAANILKPMLSKGELHCIGATTLEEYRRYIETDSALERRFQQVYVHPPSVEDTKTILRGLKPKYEVHHGVRISDRALVQAAILSDRYITGRFLPDKAIDLVDEAAARLKMEMTSQPKALDDIDREIVSLRMEIVSLKNDQGSSTSREENSGLKNKKNELSLLEKRRDELTKNWKFEKSAMDQINNLRKLRGYMILHLEQAERQEDINYAAKIKYSSLGYVEKRIEDAEAKLTEHWTSRNPRLIREEVTELEIAEIVSQWTGIPIIKVQQSERERLMNSEKELHKRVVGQDLAVKAVTKAIKCSREGLSDPNRPIASFMFLGPTGVGKTELAKALACFLFNTEEALVRIDMSEHQEKHAVSRLIGATPGYRSHAAIAAAAGQLTEKIRRRPYSVILLDEIEKAHSDILDLLLPILDDGRVTDSYGRTVNFTNTVIIMTSNVGSQQILNTHHDGTTLPNAAHHSDYESVKQRVLKSARSHFRPEFMNRVDEYIVFQPLDQGQIVDIVKLQVELVKKRIEENHRIEIEVKDGAIQRLAEWGYDPEYGARPVKRVIRQYILNEISQSILEERFKENDTISIDEDPEALPNKQLSFTKLEVGSTSTSQPTTSSEDFISEEIHSEYG